MRTLSPLHGLVLAVALAVAARPDTARADERPHARAAIALDLGASSVTGGDYDRVIANWGFGGVGTAVALSAEGGAFVAPWLMVGGRFGYAGASAGNAAYDGARLSIAMYDVSLVARVGVPFGGRVRWFAGAQLEAGGMLATASLRNDETSRVVPRFGAHAMMQVFVGRVGFGLRLGRRFAGWRDAGGPGADLDLGGFEASTGVEVRL